MSTWLHGWVTDPDDDWGVWDGPIDDEGLEIDDDVCSHCGWHIDRDGYCTNPDCLWSDSQEDDY